MIKLSVLFFLSVSICFGQPDSTDYSENIVGFVPKGINLQTNFYDNPNGIFVDSVLEPEDGWIQFEISKQDGDWVQLKNVSIAPGIKTLSHLDNSWIKISNVWFNLANDSSFCYEKPYETSNYCVVEFAVVNLIEIEGTWAKGKFKVGRKTKVGWFKKEDQCGLPWTACNY